MGGSRTLRNATVYLMARLDGLCRFLGIFFLLVMIACVCMQIFLRYIVMSPPAWTEELARYAMIWAAMLGAPCAYYRRSDPSIAQWRKSSSPTVERLRQLLETAAIALFTMPVLYFSPSTLIRFAGRETETLGLSSALVAAAVPTGLAIILLYALLRLLLSFLPVSEEWRR